MNEKNKRRAVVVWGYKNSGKTTTLKHLVNRTKRLLNKYYMIENIEGDIVNVFIKGNSPSETNCKLGQMFDKSNLPKRLIVAEQINGRHSADTITFLKKNRYQVTFFVIQKPKQYNSTHWDFADNLSEKDLDKRAEDIKAVL